MLCVCVCVCVHVQVPLYLPVCLTFQSLNQLRVFHKMRYERYKNRITLNPYNQY
jgi:hypothetical protein